MLSKRNVGGVMDRNIAVIGAGSWGKNLVRNFAELGALHAVCDNNPQVLQQYVKDYPDVNHEISFQSVLANNKIKGVVISSPAALHYSMAREALLADRDVFVEKPVALMVEEGEELVRLAAEREKILMVGHLLEYHPAVLKLKELVDSGSIGKIQYVYSNRLNLGKFRSEENILWSFAPHDISVILLLLKEMPQDVSAHGGYYLREDIADVTVTTMSFGSGVRAHIFVNWLHPYKEQRLVVTGDKKMAVFNDVTAKDKLQLFEHRIDWIDRIPVPHEQEATPVEFAMVEPLKVECQHFLDCLISRQRPKTDGISGLRVLQILNACQRSLQAGGKIISLGKETAFFIHETSLAEAPIHIGEGTKIWHFCHIMPNVNIGENCTIGQNVFVGENVNIGNNVKIENDVSVFDGVTLEDDVFCGPACVFTNVKKPRSRISQRGKFVPTIVGKGATIGANATIICGSRIGRYALIGAGSVVTKDIPDYALAYGNPARIQGWACQCGEKLDFGEDSQAHCPTCGKIYRQQGEEPLICCESEGLFVNSTD
jgi:UDP-2-acetamido-3-amino-2,3-dideoxy-glucuronate N-acetyltransferase